MAKREKVAVRLSWDKRRRDWVYHYDRRAQDGHWMHCAINHLAAAMCSPKRPPFQPETLAAFRAEMEERGFDPDTLTISVRWKAASPPPHAHPRDEPAILAHEARGAVSDEESEPEDGPRGDDVG